MKEISKYKIFKLKIRFIGIVLYIYFKILMLELKGDYDQKAELVYDMSSRYAKALEEVVNITFSVEGNLPTRDEVFIVASNHQSFLETIYYHKIMSSSIFILKKSLLKIPFYGRILWRNSIAINRKNKIESLQKLITEGEEKLSKNLNIIIYPQGTRVPYGERGKYQKSAIWMSQKLGVRILPISVNSGKLWGKYGKRYSGKVSIKIHEPIDVSKMNRNEAIIKLEEIIEGGIK
ncbi:MAG: 1-acyl-sn-glycerol-3-phosphate acyltransferase [Alphaproteobacteria bacterium]|nr:1-acyl-sn-glycerol-3-phosphate acyltransferase [Alphaproteobacteria bacterium]MBL0717845.1 1-acyl-sn-glycerol-3-phosphate acyltransferase [Alphaproteobacteria bacterium]